MSPLVCSSCVLRFCSDQDIVGHIAFHNADNVDVLGRKLNHIDTTLPYLPSDTRTTSSAEASLSTKSNNIEAPKIGNSLVAHPMSNCSKKRFRPNPKLFAFSGYEHFLTCGGRESLAGESSWGCGRSFPGTNALARHFLSEVGRICFIPLVKLGAAKHDYDPERRDENPGQQQPNCEDLSEHLHQAMCKSGLPRQLFCMYPGLADTDWDDIAHPDDATICSGFVPSPSLSTISSSYT